MRLCATLFPSTLAQLGDLVIYSKITTHKSHISHPKVKLPALPFPEKTWESLPVWVTRAVEM